jgi:orotate phosphoribosyltransferase
VREAIEIIRAAGAQPVGVAIALDRQERGRGERSAIQEVEESMGLQVISIASLDDLLALLRARGDDPDTLAAVQAYRSEYGVAAR